MNANDDFIRLVNAMAATYDRDNMPPTVAEEAFDELSDPHGMLSMNVEEGDPVIAQIQNLAALVGAAFRMAAVLMKDLTAEEMIRIIEENQS